MQFFMEISDASMEKFKLIVEKQNEKLNEWNFPSNKKL